MPIDALVDTNVLVAASVTSHPHHDAAVALLSSSVDLALSSHSLAELYNTLTKPRIYGWASRAAADQAKWFAGRFELHTLSPMENLAAIERFADYGGIGARLFDYLIGSVATRERLPRLITENVRHLSRLFPQLSILTPAQYLDTL